MAGIAAALLLTSLIGLDSARRVLSARQHLLAARSELATAQPVLAALASAGGASWPGAPAAAGARAAIDRAVADLQAADDVLSYTRYLFWIGEVVPQARGASEVPGLLRIARESAEAGQQLLIVFSPLLDPTPEESARPTTLRVRSVVVERAERIDGALARLEAVAPETRRLHQREWGAWLTLVPRQLDSVAPYLDQASEARQAFAALSTGFDPLLGFDRPRRYLLIGQNEAEIRATGGFMGSMGVITVSNGRLTDSTYDRVEAFEPPWGSRPYPTPPPELQRYMGAAWWLLRDTNQSPDFPTSAQIAMDFVRRDKKIEVDGVIALTTLTLGRLVGVFQPMAISEYREPLTASNWRGVVENTLQAGGSTPERTYLTPLLQHVIARTQQADGAQLPALLSALAVSARARDLQLYSSEERVQRMASDLGLAGELRAQPDRDVVGVVDRNHSWSKVQPGVSRDLLYLVGNNGQTDLRIRWENRAGNLSPAQYPRAMRYGDLWDPQARRTTPTPGVLGTYVSIYLPREARNIQSRGWQEGTAPGLVEENGLWVLSGFVVIRNGQVRDVVVSYQLPMSRPLTFWKQGGQSNDRLTILRNRGEQQERLFDGPFVADVTVRHEAR